MANTRDDITIPAATWTDLYTASSIAAGTAVDLWNKSSFACYIVASATQPSGTTKGIPLDVKGYLRVSAGESGLWAYSPQSTIKILVQD